jgi:hypothetical protein
MFHGDHFYLLILVLAHPLFITGKLVSGWGGNPEPRTVPLPLRPFDVKEILS